MVEIKGLEMKGGRRAGMVKGEGGVRISVPCDRRSHTHCFKDATKGLTSEGKLLPVN